MTRCNFNNLRYGAMCILLALCGCSKSSSSSSDHPASQPEQAAANATGPIVLAVNDPFYVHTGSSCVAKGNYRDYAGLAKAMSDAVGRPVVLKPFYSEAKLIDEAGQGKLDGVICKTWTAVQAARAATQPMDRLADLSMPGVAGPDSPDKLCGTFIVLKGSPIKSIKDLAGKKLAIGPDSGYEKSIAVRTLLAAQGVVPTSMPVEPTCIKSAAAVKSKQVDAAVLSNYAFHYGTLPAVEMTRDQVIVIGETAHMPFITIGLFTGRIDSDTRGRLRALLGEMAISPAKLPADLGLVRLLSPDDWQPASVAEAAKHD